MPASRPAAAGRLTRTAPLPAATPLLDPPGPVLLRSRLGLFVFLSYAVLGAWVPVFSLYLKETLTFSPQAVAWACATNAFGALVAPLLWGQVADRWLAAERCISLCALASAGLLLILAETTTPVTVFITCVLFWFFSVPVLSLGASLIFRQLRQPERDYGKVRLWGTVGWVVASLLLGLWLSLGRSDLADSMRLGGVFAAVVALYALTLPHTPPLPVETIHASRLRRLVDAPLLAFRLVRQRNFAVYCLCLFGTYVTMPFTTQMNPLLLRELGVPEQLISITLTIAQSSEIATLAFLPFFLARLQLKPTMVLGIVSWTIGLVVLAWGEPLVLVLGALVTHGVYICCFLVAGQMFVNRRAAHACRASAQGMLQLIAGLGLLSGHLLVGWLRQQTADNFALAYAPAAAGAAGLVVLFVFGFTVREETPAAPDSFVPRREMA